MKTKLNWNKFQSLKRRPVVLIIISILPAILFIQATSKQVDAVISKNKSIEVDGVMKAFTALTRSGLGGDFPCGVEMGIALEDFGRYIFSAQSGWLATVLPGDETHTLPDAGWEGNKQKAAGKMTYQNAFDRTKNLGIGTFDGTFGKRWAITDEQATEFYDQVHQVNLGGKMRAAFDHNNMFYEGLISTQILIKQNEEQAILIDELTQLNELLTERLELVEQKLNIDSTLPNVGEIKISPNPGKTNFIIADYQLFDGLNNASFVVTNIQGKTVYKIGLYKTTGKLQVNTHLPAGTYLCYLYNNSFRSVAEKLIIQ